ncbi:MAG: PAS domain-containing protein [Streptosporangiales bacterium]|nr:PAS domain-containing protein [Streptosporangiales bacterium]
MNVVVVVSTACGLQRTRTRRGGVGVRPRTLAGRFLALQLLIVLTVLFVVAAVSLAQSAESFRRLESRRAVAVAENLASQPAVRQALARLDATTAPAGRAAASRALPGVAEGARSVSGATFVLVAEPDGTIVTSPDPDRVGERLAVGDGSAAGARSWTGVVDLGDGASVVAHVPVLDDEGGFVGIVAVGTAYPSVWERLATATPNLVTYLGIASLLGGLGSWLLARRVKRQTHGLEPHEITGLAEHRDAMLHGIKEGVVGLDPQGHITLANDVATGLLGLPADCVGRSVDEVDLAPALRDVLTGRAQGTDQAVVAGGRVLTLNRRPVWSRGREIGSVTTFRDRTELVRLQEELGTTRNTTDTLRAQTHEFANQLHTISGLIQLGEFDEVVHYVRTLSDAQAELSREVTGRVHDPALAALLIAKASLVSERGVELRLADTAHLPRVDDRLSADLVTVVGNLVDNAFDALAGTHGGRVEVDVRVADRDVRAVVRDSGPGVAPELAADVFRHGFTTKAAAGGHRRGLGLALTQIVCAGRGGEVTVHNDGGAVFTARLPMRSGGPP